MSVQLYQLTERYVVSSADRCFSLDFKDMPGFSSLPGSVRVLRSVRVSFTQASCALDARASYDANTYYYDEHKDSASSGKVSWVGVIANKAYRAVYSAPRAILPFEPLIFRYGLVPLEFPMHTSLFTKGTNALALRVPLDEFVTQPRDIATATKVYGRGGEPFKATYLLDLTVLPTRTPRVRFVVCPVEVTDSSDPAVYVQVTATIACSGLAFGCEIEEPSDE